MLNSNTQIRDPGGRLYAPPTPRGVGISPGPALEPDEKDADALTTHGLSAALTNLPPLVHEVYMVLSYTVYRWKLKKHTAWA